MEVLEISYSILTQKLVTLNQIYSKNRSKKMNESITTKSGEKQEVKQEWRFYIFSVYWEISLSDEPKKCI